MIMLYDLQRKMKAIWTTLIFCLATWNLSHADLNTEILGQVARSRAVSLEEEPIEWTRDSTPVLFEKYRLYISDLEKSLSKLMEVYYFEEDWISYGPKRIQEEALEFAIFDYPGRTVRGASGFQGKILRFQIATLEHRITLIASRVFDENDDQDGFSEWLKVWESRSKWLDPDAVVNASAAAGLSENHLHD